MIALAALLGAGSGLGLWWTVAALRPAPPVLANALVALESTPRSAGPTTAAVGWRYRAAARLSRWGLPSAQTRADLQALGKDPGAHVAAQIGGMLAAFAAPIAIGVVASVAGVGIGWVVPGWLGLSLALVAYALPEARVRKQATQLRADYRHALATFLDLVVVSMSGGAGVDQALADAADSGAGDGFAAIRRAIHTARLTRVPIWDVLSDLGERIGVSEYSQLAATVGLAGVEGARVRQSLTARAGTLRAAELAGVEAEAARATERMSLPVVTLAGGFVLFIGYPAVHTIMSGF